MKLTLPNLALIGCGLTLLCVGIFRTFPIKVNPAFFKGLSPMIAALVVAVGLAAWVGGTPFVEKGIDMSVATAGSFIPLLLLLVPVMGFSMPLAAHFQPKIASLLSGSFGYPIALVTSVLSPSGNAFAALVQKLWEHRELRVLLLYFQTVIPLVSVTILYFRRLGLGDEIVMAMYRTNLWVSLGLMPVFWIWGRWFYK